MCDSQLEAEIRKALKVVGEKTASDGDFAKLRRLTLRLAEEVDQSRGSLYWRLADLSQYHALFTKKGREEFLKEAEKAFELYKRKYS